METKIKYIPLFVFSSLLASCQTVDSNNTPKHPVSVEETITTEVLPLAVEVDTTSYIYSWKTSYDHLKALVNNVDLPEGYQRIHSEGNTFTNWLRHLPVHLSDNTVYLYNGEEKYNQEAQYKVLDIDVGDRDLQQCADAVMRLRAEYLYASKQFDKIHFNYTNGVNITFSKWSSGYYPGLKGNKVVWTTSSNDKTYKSFKKYMTNIYMYAGTASLAKEMKSVPLSVIQPGDVFIKGGFPGHAVMVLDVAVNQKTGNKAFLIAQSYMPAQSIHVLRNPSNEELSPWYSLNEIDDVIRTPEWTFYTGQLKRFVE